MMASGISSFIAVMLIANNMGIQNMLSNTIILTGLLTLLLLLINTKKEREKLKKNEKKC